MYGIIDIGSNTIRLKIYKKECGRLINVIDKKDFTRLISYRKNDVLQAEGISKCIGVLVGYKHIIDLLKISRYYVIAETVFRGLENIDDVLSEIKDKAFVDVLVLSQSDEEMYSYLGATSDIDINDGCVVDIGGGSTELIFFNDNNISLKCMIACGSLNMQDAYFNDDNILDFEVSGIKNYVYECLQAEKINKKSEVIIGVGGTLRALLRLKRSETGNDVLSFTYDDVRRWYQIVMHNKVLWLRTLLKVAPERVYTLTSGLIILKTVMKYVGAKNVYVTKNGVREGFLYNEIKNEKES